MDCNFFCTLFANMNRNVKAGERAPHKLILMLAIIDEIGKGNIASNIIVLDNELRNSFTEQWIKYIGHSSVFSPVARTPFIHLDYEPYWTLLNTEPRKPLKAILDNNLFALLQDESSREILAQRLIDLI